MKTINLLCRSTFLLSCFTVLILIASCTNEEVVPFSNETTAILKNFSGSGGTFGYPLNFNFDNEGKVLEGSGYSYRHTFAYNNSNKLLQKKTNHLLFWEKIDYVYSNNILDSIKYFSVDDTGAIISTRTKLEYQGNIVQRRTYNENNLLTLSEKFVFLTAEYKYLSRLEVQSVNGSDHYIDFEYDSNDNLVLGSYERYINNVREIRYDCHLSYDIYPNPFKSTTLHESQLYKDVLLLYELAPYFELGEGFKWSTNNVTQITVFRDGNITPESTYTFDIEYNSNGYPIRKNLSRSLFPSSPIMYEYTYY